MPLTPFQQLLGQLLGTTTPTFEGGNGGPGPVGMAPGQPYPEPGRNPMDFGFDLFRGSGGYYLQPNDNFFGSSTLNPLGLYDPQGQPAQGPMAPFNPVGVARSALPPPSAQIWGVPVFPDAFRQDWTDLIQEMQRRRDAGLSRF